MAFEGLTEKLSAAFKKLRGKGRLTEADLDGFRQEESRPAGGRGLPSYPHPRRMEDFWEYPTVSMGLGPSEAIYQA